MSRSVSSLPACRGGEDKQGVWNWTVCCRMSRYGLPLWWGSCRFLRGKGTLKREMGQSLLGQYTAKKEDNFLLGVDSPSVLVAYNPQSKSRAELAAPQSSVQLQSWFTRSSPEPHASTPTSSQAAFFNVLDTCAVLFFFGLAETVLQASGGSKSARSGFQAFGLGTTLWNMSGDTELMRLGNPN